MNIAVSVIPSFGVMLTVLVLYHLMFIKKARVWLPVSIAVVIMALSSILPSFQAYQQHQQRAIVERDKAANEAAVKAFQAQYPKGQLNQAGRLTDTWVFSFTNDGQSHQVLKVGNQWLVIALASNEQQGSDIPK